VTIIRAAALSAAILLVAVTQAKSVPESLRATAAQYYAEAGKIASVAGPDSAMTYYQRLLDDADLFNQSRPANYAAETWQQWLENSSNLDLSIATQLLHASYRPMTAIRGLGEALVRSSKDGTLQPVAVYVPRTYTPGAAASLVVFLHGHLQTESHLIAGRYLTDLAEQSNTIIVAPYARGSYDYHDTESDVYDAFDAATHAFAIDPHKRYLVGYSMGGFSLFRLAPLHPDDWSAVMCINGSLVASRAAQVMSQMRDKRFYVLTGARDENVPTSYATVTAIFLRDAGLAVSFYSEPDGTHALYSLRPILTRAWGEMVRGVVRSPVGLTGGGDLPEAKP
jgi:predicted esterase